MRFELTRAEPMNLAGSLLNHSDTSSQTLEFLTSVRVMVTMLYIYNKIYYFNSLARSSSCCIECMKDAPFRH